MTTQAVAIRDPQGMQEWKSPAQIKARIQAIRQLLETTLIKDVDYGKIPGTAKPTLYKSGSEQILAMFQIAVEPIVEDLSNEDCARYRVTARLTNSLTEQFLGSGIGSASSNETKYKWRKASDREFEATPADRRRTKFGYNRDERREYEEKQVRQEPADVDNTILKMAKKRAQIDATLTVTGASSMFEQDLEDMTEETREEVTRDRSPRAKKSAPAQQKQESVHCNECGKTNGHEPTCKYAQAKCDECKATGGHLPSCSKRKQATQVEDKPPEKKPEILHWLVEVEAVDDRETKDEDPKKRKKFQIVTCLTSDNQNISLYSWHTGETWDRLKKVVPNTKCIFQVRKAKSGATEYWNLEKIVEITGEGQPIQQQGDLMPSENGKW